MKRKYDIAVVGAGFAGLACAHAAALRGLKTVVLDRKDFAGQSLHTTGILVKEAADVWDVPRGAMVRKIHGVRLYAPSLRSIDLIRGGYYFLATDAAWLMRWWSREAGLAGAELRYRWEFDAAKMTRDARGIQVADVEADYWVGADGPRSAVARAMNLGVNRRFLVGVEAEYENVAGIDADFLHVFIEPELAAGYIGWAVPGVHGTTQIGLATRKGRPVQLERFVDKVRRVFDLTKAREVSRRGGLIPVGGPVEKMAGRGALLVGDAAGLVSPLTAGGIHTALNSGRAAGLAISDHLLDAGPDPGPVVRATVPSFFFKKMMRAAMDVPVPPGVYDFALAHPAIRAAAQTVFFHHRGLLELATWRDLWKNVVLRRTA
jgi:digeranylgeranylglycerophospholipid reductase